MNIFDHLLSQGLIQDVSDEGQLRSLKSGDKFYVGFDPTAPSLQVGNLVPLTMCLRLGKAGLTPIILFGGATGAIGDPSGKNAERKLLERETIDKNIATQTRQVTEIFNREGVSPIFVNNFDWTKDVNVLEFLRDVGKHFTVNYMIAKEVVKNRLGGEGISYTEFSYMLLQAFDFHHLFQHHGCRMQIGGSDQWGNITAGLELIRRKMGDTNAVAFSIPLLTSSDGKKFGKSESGTLWLDSETTSPYKFHQFWLNTSDSDVVRYLKIFTFLDDGHISKLDRATKESPEKREAQRVLADFVTTLVHGEKATQSANKCAAVLFGGSIDDVTDSELLSIFSDAPSFEISRAQANTLSGVDLLVQANVFKSKGEARRLIEGGGLALNNEKVSLEALTSASSFTQKNVLLVRTGKKNYFIIKFI